MAIRIGVIIPYYQNKPGLLRRAVESVKAQRINEAIDLIIVDDSSPHPAYDELEGWDPGSDIRLTILKQHNSGPGIARNKGISALTGGIEYVAFLDSDDRWADDHLEWGIRSLEAGNDFYFANCLYEDNGRLHMANLHEYCSNYFTVSEKIPDFFQAAGAQLQMLILYGFAHTPTIIYRYSHYQGVRFPVDFYFYGEDQTFWLTLATQGARGIFSTHVGTLGGSGVNIYSESTWGSEKQTMITNHEIRFRKHSLKRMDLAPEARHFARGKLQLARTNMNIQLLHHLRHASFRFVIEQILDDPQILTQLPATFFHLYSKRKN